MALIHVSDLPPARHGEALGLVRLGAPHSEGEWRHCLDVTGRGASRGILSAEAIGGVLLGVAAYEVTEQETGAPGRVLRVPLLVAFELGGRDATASALRGGLDRRRAELGCGTMLFQ